MAILTSSRYSAVASTLALALAAAGTGYAATSGTQGRSAHHHKKMTNTSPTLVVSVESSGKVDGDLHRAPVTGRTKIKHPSAGFYVFTTPGLRLATRDSAQCSVANYLASSATVDRVGHALAVHVFNSAGDPANIAFQCSFWKIPRRK